MFDFQPLASHVYFNESIFTTKFERGNYLLDFTFKTSSPENIINKVKSTRKRQSWKIKLNLYFDFVKTKKIIFRVKPF